MKAGRMFMTMMTCKRRRSTSVSCLLHLLGCSDLPCTGHCSIIATKRVGSSETWMTWTWRTQTTSTYIPFRMVMSAHTTRHSDDLLRGPVQELDLDSDVDGDEPELPVKLKGKKSKQQERPLKIIPTGSDESSDDSDEDEDEDGPITIKNMEARSRALDERAQHEAELDAEEMRQAALAGAESEDDLADADDVDMDEEGEGGEDSEGFVLPTAEEREEEKNRGGPDVHTVQKRMREIVRILGNFRRYAAKGRCVCSASFSLDRVFN